VPRPARPDDVYRLRVPTEPRLSPDGRLIVATVKTVGPSKDAYRSALWAVPADGSGEARQLTLGARADHHPRFSPDGRTLAFISDRRIVVEEEPELPKDAKDREDCRQVHLLPLDGGEARRLTDLPRGVEAFEWSPDGGTLAVLTSSLGATAKEDARRRGTAPKPEPGEPPRSDYRYIDRLDYMLNGTGFTYDRVPHLWLVDAATGVARRLVAGPTAEAKPAWSPDGRRIAFTANRRRDPDLHHRLAVFVADVSTGEVTRVSPDDGAWDAPEWLPDGSGVIAIGDRWPRAMYRNGIWRFAADGSDAGPDGGRDLLPDAPLQPGASMNSDVTSGEEARLVALPDGILFTAPVDGSYELWRLPTKGGQPERLTEDRHYLSGWDAIPGTKRGTVRVAAVRSSATTFPDLHVLDLPSRDAPRRLTSLNKELETEVELVAPQERRWESDGRSIQGWLLPGGGGRQPLVVEIHGGPHTLYGWSPMWEWQVLAGTGISVLACNPRGSEGYGEEFNRANLGDWGDGPMADVIAGVDGAIDDGLADPDRLGVTGGSYGGYLTNWIVGRTHRFRAALTARSVSDMAMLFQTGDISGGEWALIEFGKLPWDAPAYFREISPISLAPGVRTPLLIQHAERDLRCTIAQAEALFTVLRSHRRPVRMMRVPEESHELTRSGTPYRRAENLVQVRDWFVHFLVRGRRGLPPVPRQRAGP
jgi:acylaminoacyl-peptidase